MNPLEGKLEYLKELSKNIVTLEGDINNILSQNKVLSNLKTELEIRINELKNRNEELISKQIELTNSLEKKEKELVSIKNEFYEQKNIQNNESNFCLGINNLSVRNTEAIHDALSFFDKKCPYCNCDLFLTTNRKQFEVDHFFPVATGGQDVPWNLLPVCQNCNRKKKDILPHIFLDLNAFKKVSEYLNRVHQSYLDEAIDSYTFKEKLSELIEKESSFIRSYLSSDFISTLLYLSEKHHIIKESITYSAPNGNGEASEITSRIVEFLNKEIPEDWESYDLKKRRNFIKGNESIPNSYPRKIVCIAEIWCECLERSIDKMDRYNTRELNTILKNLDNWKQIDSTKNFAIYGKQKYYERKNTKPNIAYT
jgi:5-methylcytosine-specific restriction endonuclease McrA